MHDIIIVGAGTAGLSAATGDRELSRNQEDFRF